MKIVTDPDLLKELNSDENSLEGFNDKVVTDPELLKELNSENNGPQIQEQYSNPTNWPGFSDLSKSEQIQKIMFSQFDPANQSPTGGYVQPGQYESKSQRMASSIIPTLMVPESKLINSSGNIAKLINSMANSIQRIGSGTVSNVAYESPEFKNKNDISKSVENAGIFNTVLEGIPLIGKAAGSISELFNPVKYMANKADKIQGEAKAAKNTMNEMYSPVNEKYGDSILTLNPKKYLENSGIERSGLYPDAKLTYDEFIKAPSFKNLHDFQSKLGEDWARTSSHPATYEKSQTFRQMRNSSKELLQNFLKRDPQALEQYNSASDFAKEIYFPYRATPNLRTISRKGSEADISGSSMASSIKKGMNKTIGREEKNVIPENHPLRQHLEDMQNRMNQADLAKAIIPILAGEVGGHLAGAGGIGLSSGIGTAGALLSPFGNSMLSKTIQNPSLQKLLKSSKPVYYAAGRSAINLGNE